MSQGRSGGVLLDTCAVIWLGNGDAMTEAALASVMRAGMEGAIHVSAISAWEIGLLGSARPGRAQALAFRPDPKAWFARFMAGPAIREAAITPDIAIDASFLPGPLHADPGDRLIIATARQMGMPIVTRDPRIIAYATLGFVEVVAC